MSLKSIRESRGLTQEELAHMIGNSKQAISRLETGSRNIRRVRDETMKKLCSALNCTEADIINENTFIRPSCPFLLIYVNCDDEVSYAWTKTEAEIKAIVQEIQAEGCTVVNALEINACRDLL